MKKFKLMLVVIMAFVGINAWGAALKTTHIETNTGVKYQITKIKKADSQYEVTVSQSDYATKGAAALSIPATISWSVNGEDEDGAAVNEEITFKVVGIENDAFKGVTKITSLTIADENIAHIGTSAFEGCTGLTTATIGSAVYQIDNNAFKGATKLATITFNAYAATTTHPNQIFGTGVFEGTAIKILDLTPTKVATVDTWFGAGSEELTTVKFPGSMSAIVPNAFKDCSALAVVTFTAPAEGIAEQTIGAGAFAGTVISNLDLTNTKVKTLNKLFEDVNADLESVTLPASLTTISASAFETCAKLSSVDLSKCTNLTTIGDYAFGTTPSLKSLDFSKCEKLQYFTSDGAAKGANSYVTPFISAGKTNGQLTTITLNAVSGKETKDIGVALAGLKALATHNIDKTKITLLAANALAGTAKITALELPATVANIEANALKGSSVAELTINSLEATPQTIAAGVYGGTDVLTTLTFKGVTKADIAAGAFTGTKINSVTFGEVKTKTANGIAAGAIVLANAASTITIAKISSADAFAEDAFTGPATATNKVALTITDVSAQPAKLVSANVGTATIGTVNANFSVDALGDAETIVFQAFGEGKTLTAATAAVKATKVVFGTEETGIALAAGSIAADAFKNADGLKIYWKPATATKAFDEKLIQGAAAGTTYGTSETTTTMKNFLYTTTAVAEKYESPFTGANELIYNVYIVAAATAAPTTEIELANNGEGKYYYGKLYNATGKYKIAKEQNGATVVVYGAYVDESDLAIYMEQLRIIDGFYYVPSNNPVIIKSTASDPITATGTTEAKTSMLTYDAKVSNQIFVTSTAKVGYTLKEDAADAFNGYTFDNNNYDLYALAKFDKYNVTWKTFGDATKLPVGTFYVHCKKAAGAAARVIWLDGSEEEATAIQTIATEAENDGAIYNLRGEKVGASYKGLVIKNGKKMIQK